MAQRRGGSAYERTFLGIAVTVTVVWAVATLVQVAFPAHVVPLTVNATMGIVATGFFGGALVAGRRSNGNGSGPPKTPQRPRKSVIEAALEAAKKKEKGEPEDE